MKRKQFQYSQFLISVVLLALIIGCQSKEDLREVDKKIILLEQKIIGFETKLNGLDLKISENQKNGFGTKWVLWESKEWVDRTAFNNFGYPKLLSAYPSKEKCMAASNEWQLPNSEIISLDPRIIQDKTIKYIYRCLPSDVVPKI
jgi:hypothetical protein